MHDTEHTKRPMCPHCNEEISDDPLADFNCRTNADASEEAECGACGYGVIVSATTEIYWTTKPMSEELL